MKSYLICQRYSSDHPGIYKKCQWLEFSKKKKESYCSKWEENHPAKTILPMLAWKKNIKWWWWWRGERGGCVMFECMHMLTCLSMNIYIYKHGKYSFLYEMYIFYLKQLLQRIMKSDFFFVANWNYCSREAVWWQIIKNICKYS